MLCVRTHTAGRRSLGAFGIIRLSSKIILPIRVADIKRWSLTFVSVYDYFTSKVLKLNVALRVCLLVCYLLFIGILSFIPGADVSEWLRPHRGARKVLSPVQQ